MSYDPDAAASGDGLFGLPHSPDDARVVVLPVPFEATTSYRRGTAGGPAAVMEASGQLDLADLQTGEPWRAGIAMEPVDDVIIALDHEATRFAETSRRAAELGDEAGALAAAAEVNRASILVNDKVRAWTAARLEDGRIPAILGGDHAVPLGAIQAAVAANPGLGILHVDAHADLRQGYEGFTFSHASILHHVRGIPDVGPIVQVGIRDVSHAERDRIRTDPGLHCWTDLALGDALAEGTPWVTLVRRFLAPLPEKVWITFDADGLDPSLCPGTGTPVPGGLSWRETLVLLRILGQSGRTVVGFDLCEVGTGPIDAIVGARLLYKLAGWALHSQGAVPSDGSGDA